MKNDFDRIADHIGKVMEALAGDAHEHGQGDSITITKDGFIKAVIRLQRVENWVRGHAESRREYRVGDNDE